MASTKTVLEKDLKKYLTKIHREIFGKGPDEVWVKINSNIGTFSCAKSLTHLEEFLLKSADGKEEVMRIRKKVANQIKPRLYSEVDNISGVKVLSITGKICIESNTTFGAILFEEDLDEN